MLHALNVHKRTPPLTLYYLSLLLIVLVHDVLSSLIHKSMTLFFFLIFFILVRMRMSFPAEISPEEILGMTIFLITIQNMILPGFVNCGILLPMLSWHAFQGLV